MFSNGTMGFLSFLLILYWTKLLHGDTCDSCTQISFNVESGLKDKTLEDKRKLHETGVESDTQCFLECFQSYRCLSFSVCGHECRLNGGNRHLVRNSLRVKAGCTYYDFPKPERRCGNPSLRPPAICLAHQPTLCLNGGSCYVSITDTTKRFACHCRHGFYGDQCEVKNPQTCLDYWTGPLKPISREYTIVDQDGNPYKVFCDFDSEDDMAWTLVESFSVNNEPHLLRYPFTLDRPLNENNLNWDLFRLSKTRMLGIRFFSEYWRATCSFPTYGVDYKDYLRVRLSVVDPLVYVGVVTYSNRSCILVDFLDIKGTSCVNCTTVIFQLTNEMLHLNPYFGRASHGCNFDSISVEHRCSNNDRARLLGVYWLCSDLAYRCSQSSSSTTQFWFGQSSHKAGS